MVNCEMATRSVQTMMVMYETHTMMEGWEADEQKWMDEGQRPDVS